MNGISVVLPCLNEEENVHYIYNKIVEVLESSLIDFEIIFVNDYSIDSTSNAVRSIKDSRVRLFEHVENLGIFEAWKTGVSKAKYKFCCVMDADGQNPPEEIVNLHLKIYESGVSLVQGKRSSIGRIKDSRYIYSKGLNFLLKLIFDDEDDDIKSGFIISDTSVLINILKAMPSNLHSPHTFIKLQAKAMGISYGTLETLFKSRHLGKSFISNFPIKIVLNAFLDIIKYKIYYRKYVFLTDVERFLVDNKPEIMAPKFSIGEKILQFIYFQSFPLHKWMVTNRVQQIYNALREAQYWNDSQIDNYQTFKLKKLVSHAYHSTTYYKKLFDSIGLKPFDIKTVNDLRKIPALTKSIVNSNLHFNLIDKDHNKKRMYKITTSGSTGTPFTVYVDVEQLEIRMATTMRAWENAGWRFGDRQLRLWHQTIGMSFIEIIKEKLDAFLNNRSFIPAFEINENNIDEIISRIEKVNPVIVDGYAECLSLIARYARRKLVLPKLKSVISSAQMLTDDTRASIEYTFGVKVIDKYGAREFSGIAYEARDSSGYPIMSESYVVTTSPFQENYEIIQITDLNNTCVPIINYQLGDLVDRSQINLTTSNNSLNELKYFPRIGKIEGRSQSVVKLLNGKLLPSAFFMHFMKDYEEYVKIFQFVQSKDGKLRLDIVPAVGWYESIDTQLTRDLNHHIDMPDFKICIVESIPLIRTGKRLAVKVES